MSETGGTKPDVAGNRWATTAPPNPISEPLGAKKDVGFATDEIPTEAEVNWLLWINGLIDNWLTAAHVREFGDIGEAIPEVLGSTVFRVGQPPGGNRAIGAQVYSLTPTGFTVLSDVASDGERVYYIDSAGAGVFAANPDDGSEDWFEIPSDYSGLAIAAEGRAVYIGASVADPGLITLNRLTGIEVARGGAQYGHRHLASNGTTLVAGGTTTNLTKVYLYSVISVPAVEDAVPIDHLDDVNAVAIDANNFYFGGDGGTSAWDVNAFGIASKTAVWQILLPAIGSAINVNSIKVDGDLVYVGTNRQDTGGGVMKNLFVLQVTDGALVASADVQVGASTVDVIEVFVDHWNVYASLGTPQFGVMSLRLNGSSLYQAAYVGGIKTGYDADGVGIVGESGGTAAERYYMQAQPVTFERVAHTDLNRRPFYKLAIPMR